MAELWSNAYIAVLAQVLQGGKAGQATLFLPGEEDRLEAAAQLVIGAAAIFDESFSSVTAAQVWHGYFCCWQLLCTIAATKFCFCDHCNGLQLWHIFQKFMLSVNQA